jgi:uncharacterized small protein (TIGR04563 family)
MPKMRPEELVTSALASIHNPSMIGTKKKQSLYFPAQMLKEIIDEAARLDRSPSWVIQRAWTSARKVIMTVPSANTGHESSAVMANRRST